MSLTIDEINFIETSIFESFREMEKKREERRKAMEPYIPIIWKELFGDEKPDEYSGWAMAQAVISEIERRGLVKPLEEW